MLLQSSMRDPDLEKAGLGQPTFTIQELDCFHADFERCQITGPVGDLILHRLRGWRAEAMDASRLDASPPGERSLKRRRKARDEPATQQEETLRSSWASRVFGSLQKEQARAAEPELAEPAREVVNKGRKKDSQEDSKAKRQGTSCGSRNLALRDPKELVAS
eukprot:CAMPEP_0115054542 /NCGR_PEP_ID=MMETSP0227-20121206/4146_1 /TAXON_ID=89957 /ORGANISM="Polarella glacialis, Strain CCMP 1383" /LENGTH=161 /DNA_ID=CAMNT_0002439017 /DNA_START=151 /DNA_END=632 /DNA_ORIENTATION=+